MIQPLKAFPRIVYMGTPEFAVLPLERLVSGGYNVVGVVTMPDKPIGRHQTVLQTSPVKQFAQSHDIPVLQPERLKDESFITQLHSLDADLQIVVAFRMLPEVVWAMPRLGTFNLHAALLPQYRGAAPINWAIINGDKQTGVSTFFLDRDIDTGRVIHRCPVDILETDNAGDVHDKLMYCGADLVIRTVDDIINGHVKTIPQEELTTDGPLRPAPKIFKDTCHIDWTRGVARTYDFIRGLAPFPAAWTELSFAGKNIVLKIYATHKEPSRPTERLGDIVSDGKTFFKVALSDGYLHLDTVQLAGKKRMDIADFLRGFHVNGSERVVTQIGSSK